MIYPATVIC